MSTEYLVDAEDAGKKYSAGDRQLVERTEGTAVVERSDLREEHGSDAVAETCTGTIDQSIDERKLHTKQRVNYDLNR